MTTVFFQFRCDECDEEILIIANERVEHIAFCPVCGAREHYYVKSKPAWGRKTKRD